jgi:hypothetical protein
MYPVYAAKSQDGAKIMASLLFKIGVRLGEWVASRLGCFIPGGRMSGSRLVGSERMSRHFEGEKMPCSCR